MQIIAGSNSKELAGKLATKFNFEIVDYTPTKYADSELNIQINGKINNDIIIVQSTHFPVNDSLMELLLITDGVKRAGAKNIIAFIPYFGYSRQNSQTNQNSPIAANLVIKMLELAGVTKVITIDLHNKSLENIFTVPIINISTEDIFLPHLQKIDNPIIISPDIGGTERARVYAQKLKSEILIINKHRDQNNKCVMNGITGSVTNRNCIIIDDIIDSAGTLCLSSELLKNQGARSIHACVTHPVLSGNAVEKITQSPIDRLYYSNSIHHANNHQFHVVEIEKLTIPF